MKKALFLCGHIGSGSSQLFDKLKQYPCIEGYKSEWDYDHPDRVTTLLSLPHKKNDASAIFMDELLYNHKLSFKSLCKSCLFVFVISDPKTALPWIAQELPVESTARHYRYRVRGLYEYALRVPNSPVVTGEDLEVGKTTAIEDYLKIEPLGRIELPKIEQEVPGLQECQECYERYLYYLKQAGRYGNACYS